MQSFGQQNIHDEMKNKELSTGNIHNDECCGKYLNLFDRLNFQHSLSLSFNFFCKRGYTNNDGIHKQKLFSNKRMKIQVTKTVFT